MLTDKQCQTLSLSPLFAGLKQEEIRGYLESSGVYPKKINKGSAVIGQGEVQKEICVLISGVAHGERSSADGRVLTVNTFAPGDIFGDVLSGAETESPVSVIMSEAGEIIAIPFSTLLCGSAGFLETRERVLRNFINEISQKYFALQRRVNLLMAPTLRRKISLYLLWESKNGENTLEISHSREEQARLLGCDRSALSRELSRMRSEGLIYYSGNCFRILNRQAMEKMAQ